MQGPSHTHTRGGIVSPFSGLLTVSAPGAVPLDHAATAGGCHQAARTAIGSALHCLAQLCSGECVGGGGRSNASLGADPARTQTLVCPSTQLCVHSAVGSVRSVGALLYRLLFLEFNDGYHRQEVVGSLVADSGASVPGQVDAALGALSDLSTTPAGALMLEPFMAFVKGGLDFIDGYSDKQVQQASLVQQAFL